MAETHSSAVWFPIYPGQFHLKGNSNKVIMALPGLCHWQQMGKKGLLYLPLLSSCKNLGFLAYVAEAKHRLSPKWSLSLH